MSGAVIEWNCTRGPVDILQNWRHTFRFNGDRHWLDPGPNSCCGGMYNLFLFLKSVVVTEILAKSLLARGHCEFKLPFPGTNKMRGRGSNAVIDSILNSFCPFSRIAALSLYCPICHSKVCLL